ncbi:GPI mannosyltransferase 1 [Tulasnella sp. JGI-2019a]|nr:GPI mannosyltransferase 1 [Tulasnella sp. JGI-2019a]
MAASSTFLRFTLLAISLRAALLIYGEYHDVHSALKYTDIDYRVFSDATKFILRTHSLPVGDIAAGPLTRFFSAQIGDPYARDTYRYTPLLAIILIPNELLHPTWGKVLFALCDILIGIILYHIFQRTMHDLYVAPQTTAASDASKEAVPSPLSQLRLRDSAIWWIGGLWLLNPMVANISTRGSAESVLGLMVISSLGFMVSGQDIPAAISLGLAAHFKIYPVIYGTSMLAVLARKEGAKGKGLLGSGWGSWRQVKFSMVCFGTFVVLSAVMYSIWGWPFLEHTYLYHISRRDHRHNFSPYFYPTYLSYPPFGSNSTSIPSPMHSITALESPLLSFLPQMILALASGLAFGSNIGDLPFTWLVQTMAFVNFNKVCTSQYFMWYLWFLPLVLPRLQMSRWAGVSTLGVWIATQAIWLSLAYRLEFLGQNVFLYLWFAGATFLTGQNYVLVKIIQGYKFTQ